MEIIPVTVTGNTRKVGIAVSIAARGVISLGLQDYTIPEDFSVSFRNPARQLLVWGNAFREDAF